MSNMASIALWLVALLATALFLRGAAMWRVWLCLALSCAAGWMAHFWFAAITGLPDVAAFILIDFIAAMVVLRNPRGPMQDAIGWLFCSMMTVNIAFVWTGQGNPQFAGEWNRALGWVQVALLLGWSLDGRYRIIDRIGGIVDAVLSCAKADKP